VPGSRSQFKEIGDVMAFALPALAEIETAVAMWRGVNQSLDRQLSMQVPAEKALRHFGLSLWGAGEVAAAIHVLMAAATLAPNDVALWSDLANAFYSAGRPEDAQAAIEIALAKEAAQPQGWLLLATILNGAHKYEEAERAFRRALMHDPRLAEASFGLGILFFQQRRFEEAIACLREASAQGCHNVGLYVCFGQALFLTGRFIESAEAFTRASRFEATDKMVLEKLALLHFIKTVIEGSVETAIADYRATGAGTEEDVGAVVQKVFQLLSAYGYEEAAARLGETWLAWAPEDPVRRYLVAAVSGEPMQSAPPAYLIQYFNGFAEGFDRQLVSVLLYKVPEELHSLLNARRQYFARILDLGCGTGLAARFLQTFGGKLTGVDISPMMLEKAAARQLYDQLVESEAVAYLTETQATFDLIFVADMLVYIGDLTVLLSQAARLLERGGVFACSVETTELADFALLPSGRFAHRLSHILALAQKDFGVLETMPTTIRLEANRPVPGALVILQRL
jgi:predicted TPR repeat methyltransferase/Flp pilus assembly protein TadD